MEIEVFDGRTETKELKQLFSKDQSSDNLVFV